MVNFTKISSAFGWLLAQTFDVLDKNLVRSCYKKDFMKKYQNLAEIFSENLENRVFLVYHPSIMVTWQVLRADKVSKIILKVVQEDFDIICKEFYWFLLLFSSRFCLFSVPNICILVVKFNPVISLNWYKHNNRIPNSLLYISVWCWHFEACLCGRRVGYCGYYQSR